jgi:hypothetical protein
MAGCNQVRIESDFRTLPELDTQVQRFSFDDEHMRLRDAVAIHTIEDSQDIETFQLIHGPGVRGIAPENFKGVGARYVQIMGIRQGHLSEFMASLDELTRFHESLKMPPVTVWAIRR